MHSLFFRHRITQAFRTDAEGNFPLSPDWPALLARLADLSLVVTQTRNAAARLVTLAPFPALDWAHDLSTARDEAASLVLDAARWASASARVAHCHCCGSVGRIQITDSTGAECLQICPHPDVEPADWAAALAPFRAARPSSSPSFAAPSPSSVLRPPFSVLRNPSSALPALLDRFARDEAPLLCELPSPGALQRRKLLPLRLSRRHGLLTASDGMHTLQIALPGIARLHLSGNRLDALAADGSLALSLRPSDASAALWDEALSCL